MINEQQALLAKVIDVFAETFDKKAILRGGMVLRILGSPRFTNDLDYVFVPFRSKNEIVKEILTCLKSIENAEVSHTLNSKCLRVILKVNQVIIQIEAHVAMNIDTSVATTQLFSPQFHLPKRIIHVVDHSTSMANKLAAWNERRLARDLYDIWFFVRMNIKPNLEILRKRLKKPLYSRLVKEKDYFPGGDVDAFYEFVRQKAAELDDHEIADQLSDYLTPDELIGLPIRIRAALATLFEM